VALPGPLPRSRRRPVHRAHEATDVIPLAVDSRPAAPTRPLGGYLFNLIYDISPARLGRGGRRVALSCGCPRHHGV